MGFPLLDIVNVGARLIDKLIPDPKAKAEALQKLKELEQAGDLAKMNADLAVMAQQADINKTEAASSNMFIAGWRPAVGWVCAAGLAMSYLIGPLVTWFSMLVGHPIIMPPVDMATLMPVLLGMLGMAGLRTYEKMNNVEKNR